MNEMIFSSVFPFWDKLDDDDKTAIKDGHITKTFEKGSVVHRSDMGCQGAIMEENPYVGLYMYQQATERFSEVMWTMQQILFMAIDKRVAIYLWDESISRGQITIKTTHDEIARNIGSAREVVTKVLNYFAEEGVVTLGRGRIEIADKEKLKTYL